MHKFYILFSQFLVHSLIATQTASHTYTDPLHTWTQATHARGKNVTCVNSENAKDNSFVENICAQLSGLVLVIVIKNAVSNLTAVWRTIASHAR